ncbi:MAG TPA: hypothetical protein PL151_15090 [Phycisphaerae bacterium]|nr:hypothetical protein [Phycisphaerae bacterium]HOM53211.1 hypothetical protein [Phycisphaerae bacterium]HOQ86007.1 hypothetical protein [Phycisphaerae bacterium]HPU27510.1 hypothetical protein [Phycisphaerae bacterium]HQE29083.1 hypothetical protein [Phycisphaerae bacterium]
MSTVPQSKPMLAMAAFPQLAPGDRIRVTERIVGMAQTWVTQVEGEVIACRPETTGSWFTHGKRAKLWLLRVRLRKPDGEITTLNLDQNSQVEILSKASR